jgi:hypothetical protein
MSYISLQIISSSSSSQCLLDIIGCGISSSSSSIFEFYEKFMSTDKISELMHLDLLSYSVFISLSSPSTLNGVICFRAESVKICLAY